MNDKKAAKKLIKRAKEHPDWYTKKEIWYAKMIKRELKHESKISERNSCLLYTSPSPRDS